MTCVQMPGTGTNEPSRPKRSACGTLQAEQARAQHDADTHLAVASEASGFCSGVFVPSPLPSAEQARRAVDKQREAC